MLNRRDLLVGAATTVATLAISPLPVVGVTPDFVSALAPLQQNALLLIVKDIRDFLERVGKDPYIHRFPRVRLVRQYREWVEYDCLDEIALDKIRRVYEFLVLTNMRERRGPLVQNGKMIVEAQDLFFHFLPFIPDRGRPELFEAFASFAPAHLL